MSVRAHRAKRGLGCRRDGAAGRVGKRRLGLPRRGPDAPAQRTGSTMDLWRDAPLRRMLLQQHGWSVSENGIKKVRI